MKLTIALVAFVVLFRGIEPYEDDDAINDLFVPNNGTSFISDIAPNKSIVFKDNVINNRPTPSRKFNSFNYDSFDSGAFPDDSSFVFKNNSINNRPGFEFAKKKRKTPRPVSPKRPRVVKNLKKSPTKTASTSKSDRSKIKNVPITFSSDDDKKVYGFSNLEINCNGCSGVNSYWKGDKFYINDVEIKNCKRGDKLEISGNKVKLNGKFNTNI